MGSWFPYILLNEIQTMFSQLAKRSARLLPANLCTDHVHYVKNHRSTVLRRNKNMAVEGGTVSHYYILVIRKFIDFMSLFRHSVWFSFSVKQLPSAEFGICNIWFRTADKNRRWVAQGTELSVVVVICLLGSFWILTLDSRCWLIVMNEVKCYEVWMFI